MAKGRYCSGVGTVSYAMLRSRVRVSLAVVLAEYDAVGPSPGLRVGVVDEVSVTTRSPVTLRVGRGVSVNATGLGVWVGLSLRVSVLLREGAGAVGVALALLAVRVSGREAVAMKSVAVAVRSWDQVREGLPDCVSVGTDDSVTGRSELVAVAVGVAVTGCVADTSRCVAVSVGRRVTERVGIRVGDGVTGTERVPCPPGVAVRTAVRVGDAVGVGVPLCSSVGELRVSVIGGIAELVREAVVLTVAVPEGVRVMLEVLVPDPVHVVVGMPVAEKEGVREGDGGEGVSEALRVLGWEAVAMLVLEAVRVEGVRLRLWVPGLPVPGTEREWVPVELTVAVGTKVGVRGAVIDAVTLWVRVVRVGLPGDSVTVHVRVRVRVCPRFLVEVRVGLWLSENRRLGTREVVSVGVADFVGDRDT